MKNINSHIIKITSGAELSGELDDTKTVKITDCDLDIYSITDKNNDDGSYNRIYKARITSAIEYEQSGKVMRGSDKKGWSKKLRGAIYFLGTEEKSEDSELFYEIVMRKIIVNLPEIWEIIRKK